MDFCLPSQLEGVRSKHPLVHHITNYVTVNDCANICICAGGSPVMTDALEDVEDMVGIADAIVINMGTLNPRTVESMLLAGTVAKKKRIPVVFDPVGAGATKYRNCVAERIIKLVKPDIIKGNDGEIAYLSGVEGGVRGVDSTGPSGDSAAHVKSLAGKLGCIVASTGKVDHVSDGKDVCELSNGCDMLGTVSGTGCMVSSAVGCYAGANGANMESVIAAITSFNIAAESAVKMSRGPGTFKASLMDCMFGLKASDLDCAKIRRLRSEHLQFAGDAVQFACWCGSEAHARYRAGVHLRPPSISDDRYVYLVAAGHHPVLVQLLQRIHFQDDLGLTA